MSDAIRIQGRPIGREHEPFVIAEMSANHNQNLDRALEILEAAHAAGAHACKLQTYRGDTITLDQDGPSFRIQGGLWSGRRLFDLYEEAHTPWEWHEALFRRGGELGVTVFSSPFDFTAVDLLESLDAPAYKVASPEIVDIPLIRYIAKTGKPMIMSTGMAMPGEIYEAVRAARGAGCSNLALLHCVSAYPTPVETSNLRVLADLATRFEVIVGLSDHSAGTTAAVCAVALGAALIEKHFTLSRADGGVDSAFSLEPDELSDLVRETRNAWLALGDVVYRSGIEDRSLELRRSLYIVEDVAKREPLTPENLRSIRPAHGIHTRHYEDLLGRQATRALRRGEPVTLDMVEQADRAIRLPDERTLRLDLATNTWLSPIRAADVTEAYVSGLNDPEVNRFLAGPRSEKQTKTSVQAFVTANDHAADAILFGLYVDGVLRGTCRLHDISPDAANVGIAIFDKRVWGKGLGYRVVAAVCSFAFEELGLERILAGVHDVNAASTRTFERVGFMESGCAVDSLGMPYTQWVLFPERLIGEPRK